MALLKRISVSTFIVITTLILVGCGGGSDSKSNTPEASSADLDITGRWLYHYSQHSCKEAYEFNGDGTFEVISNEVTLSGNYAIEALDQGARHKLIMETWNQSDLTDCENISDRIAGSALEVYIALDGENSLTWYESKDSTSPTIELVRDNPITLSNQSPHVALGETITLNVSSNYASSPKPELVYGPKGMTLSDDGTLSWQSDLFMLTDEARVKFAISRDDAFDIIEQSILVTAEKNSTTLARTMYATPNNEINKGAWVGDFDGDGSNEVLSVDKKNNISLFNYKNDTYTQKWVYPFALFGYDEYTRIAPFDMDKDGDLDILVMTSRGIYQILDEKSQATTLLTTEKAFKHFYVADTNRDGYAEIALIEQTSREDDTGVISLWDSKTQSYIFQSDYSQEPASIHIENLDSDAPLEVIISNGNVFDGKTGINQWHYPDGFGDWLDAGDFDGDGQNEIVSATKKQVRIFDPRVKQETYATGKLNSASDFCSLLVTDIDADSTSEITLDDCGDGLIRISFLAPFIFTKKLEVGRADFDSFRSSVFRRNGLSAGDIDNDGEMEFIQSSGTKVRIIETQPELETAWQNDGIYSLERISANGWAQLEPGVGAAVYYTAPRAEEGNKGRRVVTINLQGDVNISEQIGDGGQNGNVAILADYNRDGYTDMFMSVDQDGGSFNTVREIASQNTLWGNTSATSSTRIHDINNADLNQDGYPDIIAAVDDKKLELIDIHNHTIFTSLLMPDGIDDIASFTTKTGETYIVVSVLNGWDSTLTLYHYSGKTLTQVAQADDNCKEVSFTTDGQSILCAPHLKSQLNIYNNQLVLQKTYETDYQIMDIATTSESSRVLVAHHSNGAGELPTGANISLFSLNSGTSLWSIPTVNGRINGDSVHFIENTQQPFIVFATDKIMYITR